MDVPFLIRGGGLVLFAYAAVCDYRYRRAPDLVWGLIAALGIGALSLELQTASSPTTIVIGIILSTILVSSVAIASWQSGWIGGADAKAAIVLPIIYPHLPGVAFEEHVFGVLTQGLEVVIWVWAATAIAGLWFSRPSVDERYQDGIPFLIPLFVGVTALFLLPSRIL